MPKGLKPSQKKSIYQLSNSFRSEKEFNKNLIIKNRRG